MLSRSEGRSPERRLGTRGRREHPGGHGFILGRVGRWRLPDYQPTHHVIRLQSVAQSIAFHPNGNVLTASLASGEVLLWDVNTGLPCGVPMRHETFSPSVRFSPDGRWLASGSFDHTVFCRELPEWIGNTNVEATETRVQKLIGAKIGKFGTEETLSWEQWQAIDRVPIQAPGQ